MSAISHRARARVHRSAIERGEEKKKKKEEEKERERVYTDLRLSGKNEAHQVNRLEMVTAINILPFLSPLDPIPSMEKISNSIFFQI